MADQFPIKEGILYYHLEVHGRRTRWVMSAPEGMREKIILDAHSSPEGGHAGKFKTVERIQQHFYFPSITNLVDKAIKDCVVCQTASAQKIAPAPLQMLPIVAQPNFRVHADLFGDLKTSRNGNKFVLVITDAFTKYTELAAIEKKDATTVARAFMEKWIWRYGPPQQLVTDQGKEFTNATITDICSLLNVKKICTTAYHPATNSAAESFNRVIIKYFKKMLDNNATMDWEPQLAALMYSYNTSIHKSIADTPFFLTYLRDPNSPIFDTIIDKVKYKDDYVTETMAMMMNAYKATKDNLENSTQLAKQYLDKSAKERPFKVGDVVMLHVPVIKLHCKYLQDIYRGLAGNFALQ